MAGSPWSGLDDALKHMTKTIEKAGATATSIVAKGSAVAEAAMKRGFAGSHAAGQPHQGGSQPNIVTGALRRSIVTDPIKRYGIAEVGTRVGPTVIYARRIELGYPGGGGGPGHQMTRPFPYVQPAIKATRPKLRAIGIAGWSEL